MYNLLLNTDSYKTSHFRQYPPQSEIVSSYIESRGGRFPFVTFFGLQAFIQDYLMKPITSAMIDEAEELITAHGLPFHRGGWEIIRDEYQGFLPLSIQAVPEGLVVPTSQVLLQVQNTDPRLYWLTSYVETALLRAVWYPTTVATQSYALRQVLAEAMDQTVGHQQGLEFKLHDFGARGVSSEESSALGGLAHLLSFQGTDNISALLAARRFYAEPMAGFSIPAAEHSTMTSWGRDQEAAAYRNMVEAFGGPGRIFAVVSDSYDLWQAIGRIWGGELKDLVINQGGTLVIRPDSGDPVAVVTRVIEELMQIFGSTTNAKGYRVLPPYIRVIQGDGVSYNIIRTIVETLKARSISVENLAFGMGGELLQKVDRDTQKFAMKASAIRVNGVWRDVAKDPVTDPGKASKKGRLALIRGSNGELQTIREDALQGQPNVLEPVYLNGRLLRNESLAVIRQRLRQ